MTVFRLYLQGSQRRQSLPASIGGDYNQRSLLGFVEIGGQPVSQAREHHAAVPRRLGFSDHADDTLTETLHSPT